MNLARVKVTTAPTWEPVTLADAKAHLVVDGSADNVLIADLITVAREACEDITGRKIPSQGITITMDAWPRSAREQWWDGMREGAIASLVNSEPIDLPGVPLQSVESITTYDDANAATIVDPATYFIDASDDNQPGRVCLRYGATWPSDLRPINGIVIEATVGYATAPATPSALRRAVLMILADLYANRGDAWTGDGMTPAARSGALPILERYTLRNL